MYARVDKLRILSVSLWILDFGSTRSIENNLDSFSTVGRQLKERVRKGEESNDVAHVMWREQTEKLVLRFVGWTEELKAIAEEIRETRYY